MNKNDYFQRTLKIPLLRSRKKNKLLPLIIKRLLRNSLTTAINHLKNHSHHHLRKMLTLATVSRGNLAACLLIAWNKLKANLASHKTRQTAGRTISMIASHRLR
jgi:hypothetical protein